MQVSNEIDESQYKADFMISENYIKFSGELLRLSLLAIGGFGTLILTMIKEKSYSKDLFPCPMLFILALGCFVFCSAACLFHRYYATDAISWYICLLRAKKSGDVPKIAQERSGFHRMLRLSRNSLILSEISFGLGVFFFFLIIQSYI